MLVQEMMWFGRLFYWLVSRSVSNNMWVFSVKKKIREKTLLIVKVIGKDINSSLKEEKYDGAH